MYMSIEADSIYIYIESASIDIKLLEIGKFKWKAIGFKNLYWTLSYSLIVEPWFYIKDPNSELDKKIMEHF